MGSARWLAGAIAAVAMLCVPASAAAIKYAPINRDGPKLTVPRADLKASVECSDGVKGAARQPVLLLPATGVDSERNFAWNYERAFTQAGIPFCTSDQAGELRRNMDDIQTRGEYVTYAIRKVHRMAGRPIATLGHSQGGMITRWSLRFWPDTRRMVDDVIGLAGSNHGTESGAALLRERLRGRLPPAGRRRRSSSPRSTRAARASAGSATPRSSRTTTRWSCRRAAPASAAPARSPTWRSRRSARPIPRSTWRSAPATRPPTPS